MAPMSHHAHVDFNTFLRSLFDSHVAVLMSQEPEYHKHVDLSVRLSEIHAYHPIPTFRNGFVNVEGLMNMINSITPAHFTYMKNKL